MNQPHRLLEVILEGKMIKCSTAADTVAEVLKRLIHKFGRDAVIKAENPPEENKG